MPVGEMNLVRFFNKNGSIHGIITRMERDAISNEYLFGDGENIHIEAVNDEDEPVNCYLQRDQICGCFIERYDRGRAAQQRAMAQQANAPGRIHH